MHRRHWTNADPIRRIFKNGFALAGLDYFNPHRIRDTLALLGERICTTPEEFKAWSQNLAHEGVLTTFTSYGTVSDERQAEIMAPTHRRPANEISRKGPPDAATIKRVLHHLSKTTD